jgi:hypothetical protein
MRTVLTVLALLAAAAPASAQAMRDLKSGTTTLVSKDLALVGGVKQKCTSPALSGDGRFVVFLYGNGEPSGATSVPYQVWMRDTQLLTSQLVSIPPPCPAVRSSGTVMTPRSPRTGFSSLLRVT